MMTSENPLSTVKQPLRADQRIETSAMNPQLKQLGKQLHQLQHRLVQAARDEKWFDMRKVDGDIRQLVLQIKLYDPQGQLDPQIAQLRKNYQQIIQSSKRQLDAIEHIMAECRNSQQGALAYQEVMEAAS